MAQKNRVNMLADIVTNIFNNVINYITGQNAQDRFVNLLDSSPNILSDKDQANGYVGTNANNEMYSGYYNLETTRADLVTALGANLAVGGKTYRVTDAVGSTLILWVTAESNLNLYSYAIDVNTGEIGAYDISLDTFTVITGSGNANITTITVAALQALETGSTLSTTTLYVVDSTPYKLMCKAETVSQLSKTATIVDDVYAGTVHYDLQTNTWSNGTIYDADGNTWNGCLPSTTTLGASPFNNQFFGSGTNVFGDSARYNTIKQNVSGFILGDSFQNTTIEVNVVGTNYTASPDYDFLYNNIEPCTIIRYGSNNYHLKTDPTNGRIVVTLMASPFTVSYIGGSGGGDMVLASAQTNTGLKTFLDGSFGLRNIANTFTSFFANAATAARTWTLQNRNGILADDTDLATKLDVAAAANYRLTASDGSGNRGNAAAITAARALKSDANGVPTHFDTATEPSLTELSYVKGVTSAIQTQLDALANTQTLTCFGLVLTTVADSSNYHIGTIAGAPSSSDARRAFRFTKAGTVTDAAFTLEQVTNGSNETVNIYLRNVTTATDTAIGTFTSDFGASTTLKALFTGLGISVNTADDYTIRISTPAFGTNPTSWIPSLTLQITV